MVCRSKITEAHKMRKEIYMGYGLYKYIEVKEELKPEEVEWRIVETEDGGFIRRPFPKNT